jgi:hypothetical protein
MGAGETCYERVANSCFNKFGVSNNVLPREDVDMLIKVAPELLHENPKFNQLLRDLSAIIAD